MKSILEDFGKTCILAKIPFLLVKSVGARDPQSGECLQHILRLVQEVDCGKP